ncbi:MAG: N-acetylneuraminate synthase family protein [Candidatus Omnitrophota bacterium]
MMNKIRIGNRRIGKGEPAFIIAEIGSNHDGKLMQAKKLIRQAAEAGADAVKFQSFSAEGLLSRMKPDEKGKWSQNPAYEKIKELELKGEWHRKLSTYAKKCDVIFMSTPFDEEKAKLLNSVGVPAFKIASGDMNYFQLLKNVAGFKKPVILSTGMATIKEVEKSVNVIRAAGNRKIILLHCTAAYPSSYGDVNIKAMQTLGKKFGLPVGLSDHTEGIEVPVAAAALGANVIEKHITLDRNLKGPDHHFAITVDELKEMIKQIRNVEEALGDGVKRVAKAEKEVRARARRSIYAKVDIPKGSAIKKDAVKIVRQGRGLTPKDLGKVLGKKAKRTIKKDTLIRAGDLWS